MRKTAFILFGLVLCLGVYIMTIVKEKFEFVDQAIVEGRASTDSKSMSTQKIAFRKPDAKDLSPKETELVNKLGFNIKLMKELKAVTKSELVQLPAIEETTADVLNEYYSGIHSGISEEKASLIVKEYKEKFREEGYLIFVFTGEDDLKSIGVLKGTNDLDILRYRRTNGINYDLENEDIVAKVSDWNKAFGLNVIGCGRDWLELEFKKLPSDLDAFSEEVYEFCPDSVDQGVGEVENLNELIKELHGIWLWWD